MEGFANGQKGEEKLYIEEPSEYTNEVVIENVVEPDAVEGNEVPVYEVVETVDKIVAVSSNESPGASDDIGTNDHLVSSEYVPRSTILSSGDDNKGYVEGNNNTPVDMENREITQPLISANPSLVQRPSWADCCGLFRVLRRSGD